MGIEDFFSYFIELLGCFITSITSQKILIIDLASFPNVINGFNSSDSNPWEFFFEQPYNLTLQKIKKKQEKLKRMIVLVICLLII